MVQDTYEYFICIDCTLPGLVMWNKTTYAKKMWSYKKLAAFVATMQVLVNYTCV